jgi:hypothetical protein
MNKDFWLMIAGVVLSAVSGYALPKVFGRIRQAWRLAAVKRHSALIGVGTSRLREWIERYYIERGRRADLFRCRIGDIELCIPVLTRPNWCRPMSISSHRFVEVMGSARDQFPVNHRLLSRRRSLGQNIFDGVALYADRIVSSNEGVCIIAKRCEYLAVASTLIGLEEEALRAAQGDRTFGRGTPLRDRVLGSIDLASQVLLKPLSLGCATVIRLRMRSGERLLVHRRSAEVITSPGAVAVMPCFGLEPLEDTDEGGYGDVLFLNIIKEYCEEVCGHDDLVHVASTRRGLGRWIGELEPARRLIHGYAAGFVSVDLLGVGIDAINGTVMLAVELVVSDAVLAEEIARTIVGNWEVSRRTPERSVLELISPTDPRLSMWLASDEFAYPSAFALSLALIRTV